jgi:hypothetical protein
MLDKMRAWFDGCGRDKQEILNRLTADAVRGHRNKRLGDNTQAGGGEHNHGSLGGGLQGVLASHNVSVVSLPSISYALMLTQQARRQLPQLCSGFDGRKNGTSAVPFRLIKADDQPWQQGFGTGGPNAWRDIDGNEQPGQGQGGYNAPPQQQQYHNTPPQQYHNTPPQQYNPSPQHSNYQPPQPHYDQNPGYQAPPQQYGGQGQGGYNSGPDYGHQQQGQQYGQGPPGGFGGPPQYGGPQGYDQGPPQGQWGQGRGQGGYQHHQPPSNDNGGWGPPGGFR